MGGCPARPWRSHPSLLGGRGGRPGSKGRGDVPPACARAAVHLPEGRGYSGLRPRCRPPPVTSRRPPRGRNERADRSCHLRRERRGAQGRNPGSGSIPRRAWLERRSGGGRDRLRRAVRERESGAVRDSAREGERSGRGRVGFFREARERAAKRVGQLG
jgi:hypothetical protein